MKRILGMTLVAIVGFGLASAPAEASSKPCVQVAETNPGYACQVKPKIFYTSVSEGVGSIHWGKWGKKKAIGHGRLAGHKAKIVLTKPTKCGGGKRAFSYVVITFKSGSGTEGWADNRIPGACRGV